jgi:hypothetical protein
MTFAEKKKAVKELIKSGITYLQIDVYVEDGVCEYDYGNVFYRFGWIDDEYEVKAVFEEQEFEEIKEDGEYTITCFLSYSEEQRSFAEHIDIPAHWELDEYEIVKMEIEDDGGFMTRDDDDQFNF